MLPTNCVCCLSTMKYGTWNELWTYVCVRMPLSCADLMLKAIYGHDIWMDGRNKKRTHSVVLVFHAYDSFKMNEYSLLGIHLLCSRYWLIAHILSGAHIIHLLNFRFHLCLHLSRTATFPSFLRLFDGNVACTSIRITRALEWHVPPFRMGLTQLHCAFIQI